MLNYLLLGLLGLLLEPLLLPGVAGALPEPDLLAPAAPEPALPLELGDALGEADEPPPEALEPALAPKCLSHSAREIWPSPFASTVVKLGCALEALEAPPLDALSELLDELPDDALLGELGLLGELAPEPGLFVASELLDPVALGVLEAPGVELCACATPAIAKSAAAVAVARILTIIWIPPRKRSWGEPKRSKLYSARLPPAKRRSGTVHAAGSA